MNRLNDVVLYRVIEVNGQFRPEVLTETSISILIRKIFPRKAPVYAWYGIGGFGYTTCRTDMCTFTTDERATFLVESFTGAKLKKIDY